MTKFATFTALSLLLATSATSTAFAAEAGSPDKAYRQELRAEMQDFRTNLKASVEAGALTREEAKAQVIAKMEQKRAAIWAMKEQRLIEKGKTAEEIAEIKERMQSKFEQKRVEHKALIESLKADGKTKEEIREILKQKRAEYKEQRAAKRAARQAV